MTRAMLFCMVAPWQSPVSIYNKLLTPPTACTLRRRKGSHANPKVQDCRAKPDGWFEYTKVVLRVLRVASVSDSAPCHTRVARVARSVRSGDPPLVPPLGAPPSCYTCCAFCRSKRTGCGPGWRGKKKRVRRKRRRRHERTTETRRRKRRPRRKTTTSHPMARSRPEAH